MKKVPGVELIGICTATGSKARHVGEKFGFRYCTTDELSILDYPEINTVVVATRHHLHARQVVAALDAGKHIFCEKPLCLSESELRTIIRRYEMSAINGALPILAVGYNRRFAPLALRMKEFLGKVSEPLVMHYRVNAGIVQSDNWVHDPMQGGGRLIGEVCHFVDFLTFLAGAPPARAHARALPNQGRYHDDNLLSTLEYPNGSLGTIAYVANGDRRIPKERLEVFGGGAVSVLDDFRRLELVRAGKRRVYRSWFHQDKGHRAEWVQFVRAVTDTGSLPIPFVEIVSTSLVTFKISEALRSGDMVSLDHASFMAEALDRPPSADPAC
jgi:predicted dehydrogenase